MAFDLRRAYCLVQASELVYEPPENIRRTVLEQWRFRQMQFFDVDDTQCIVAASDETVIVAFRGTESTHIEDWITNFDFDLADGPLGGRVHQGFYEALSNVWQLVDRQVAWFCDDPRRRLWVTGHSQGAALATLAVARWREMGRPVAGLAQPQAISPRHRADR